MSKTTTNYALVKPELTDAADITAMNANWDKIDSELKKASKSEVFIATYGSTTYDDVKSAYDAGKAIFCIRNQYIAPLQYFDGSGDMLFCAFQSTTGKMWVYTLDTESSWSYSRIDTSPSTHASTHASTGSDPITPQSIGAVKTSGDTLTGVLSFQNKEAYAAIGKFRTINGTDYYVDFGCGNIGGKGCVSMKYMEGDTVKGKLEISGSGVSFYDENNNRTYLCRNNVIIATVE